MRIEVEFKLIGSSPEEKKELGKGKITIYDFPISEPQKESEKEPENEWEQKRERYIKQLSDLQKQNKQLKGGLRRLKDKVKSYRAKLKEVKEGNKTIQGKGL